MVVLKPGDKIGEYMLEAPVGRGTFGEVWRAHHAVLRKPAAVKVPTDPEYIKNLRTEGIIQFEIDNPHVVRTLGIDPWHDPPYLATEFVEGQSLREVLKEGVPLAVETAVNYARQILDALSAAHAAGVIHRDLKPENILIDKGGVLKITDFGLGRVQETTASSILQSGSLQSQSGSSIVGTMEYMAPEQKVPGGDVDHRADLYAFGVVLFEMLTGMRPTGSDAPSDLARDVAPHLDGVFLRCHCHVGRRCRSAGEVLAALDSPSPSQGDPQGTGRVRVEAAPLTPTLSPEGRGSKMMPPRAIPAAFFPMTAEEAAEVQRAAADAFGVPVEWTNSIGMRFRLIPRGEFLMGSPAYEKSRESDEVQHQVTMNRPYYLGATQATQAQYETVMGKNPSHFKGRDLPVEEVSWEEAVVFCQKLTEMDRRAGRLRNDEACRLPTEAEWEYACRAGEPEAWNLHGVPLENKAWYGANSGGRTHRIGQLMPNRWGLYDMHGNVWEWCSDRYGEYTGGAQTDPTGPPGGASRVVRGGSWFSSPWFCRSAGRCVDAPVYRFGNYGLRVARTVVAP